MSAKPVNCDWGLGAVWSAPVEGSGGAAAPGAGVSGAQADRLSGMSAGEAIETIKGNFAEVKPGISDPSCPRPDEVFDDIELPSFPGPIAEAFYWDRGDIIGIQGPVGSGKTTTLLKSRLLRAIEMPRSSIDDVRRYKLLAVRETYRQLWSTTIPSYLENYPKALGQWSGGRGDPVTHVMLFRDEYGLIEFTVEFMAFGDDIAAAMRGIQTTDIWLNEADTIPADVLSVGVGRINRWPGARHFRGYPIEMQRYGQIVGDFNAPDEDNWTFGVFHDEEKRAQVAAELTASLPAGSRPVSINFYNQPGYGQPGCENLQNLGPGYYEVQIAANKLSGKGDLNARLVYNKVVYLKVGDPVFENEFNRRIHVSDEPLKPIPGVPLRIGLDQGFKGAAVIGQYVEGRWRILAELHFPHLRLLARKFGDRLRDMLDERFPGHGVEAAWGDMAGEHGASQAADENATWNLLVGRAAKIHIRPQVIGTNRIQPRLEAVRAPLEWIYGGAPGLLIDPSCKFLIRGFEARYVWAEEVDASGDKRKVPNKKFTEANVMDALQYLLLSEHRGDGTSRIGAGRGGAQGAAALPGKRGAPPPAGGLKTGWDITNPYGGRS